MKKITTFLVMISLISCNYRNEKPIISLSIIDSISVETIDYVKAKEKNRSIITSYSNLPIFIKFNDTCYSVSSPLELYDIYMKKYKSGIDSYNAFLKEVINNEIKLDKNDFVQNCFNLDNEINKNFNKFEIEDFLNYYSVKDNSENKPYLNKKIKTENEYLTISYLLFTKGYYLGEDDIRGRSYIYSFDKVIK